MVGDHEEDAKRHEEDAKRLYPNASKHCYYYNHHHRTHCDGELSLSTFSRLSTVSRTVHTAQCVCMCVYVCNICVITSLVEILLHWATIIADDFWLGQLHYVYYGK